MLFIAAIASTSDAHAIIRSRVKRTGIQSTLLLGSSMCISGKSDCSHPTSDMLAKAHGHTGASFGFAKELGFRIPWLFVGAAYNFGLFNPRWDIVNQEKDYRIAYHHSLLAVFRPILPVWRFDFGLTLAPGWSRQVFRREKSSDRDFTQGFVMDTGFMAAFYLTKRAQIGFRIDFLRNSHTQQCQRISGTVDCQPIDRQNVLPVNQMMTGLYLSRTFL